MLYDIMKQAEIDFRYDPDETTKRIQEFLNDFRAFKTYQITVKDDISAYERFAGIQSSFELTEDKGRFYFCKDTKQVVLISSFGSDDSKYKIVSLNEVTEEEFSKEHHKEESLKRLKRHPLVYADFLRLKYAVYILSVLLVPSIIIAILYKDLFFLPIAFSFLFLFSLIIYIIYKPK